MTRALKTSALAVASLATAVKLSACGSSHNGTYTGDVTNVETGQKEGTATLKLGNKCHWSFTDSDGNTGDARCESSKGGKELKLADVKTARTASTTASSTARRWPCSPPTTTSR